MTGSSRDGPLLALDTATSRVVVAVGTRDGSLLAAAAWPAGHRHGEQLLASVERVLGDAAVRRADLAGIVVGTGPGAFTGLRVGLATAKALGHGLRLPIAGVPTADALIAAAAAGARVAAEAIVLLLPAGPTDRVIARLGRPAERLAGDLDPEVESGALVVAVDLQGRAAADAVARGEAARDGLAAQLVRLGAARLAAGGDDLAALVPEYVTLPRGVAAASGEVAWSRGR